MRDSLLDYMIIGRVMSYVGKEYGYINHTKITKIFVGADVFAILTQGAGGGMLVRAVRSGACYNCLEILTISTSH